VQAAATNPTADLILRASAGDLAEDRGERLLAQGDTRAARAAA
jgi:hypothetical protein